MRAWRCWLSLLQGARPAWRCDSSLAAEYVLQALIAAEHARAAQAQRTDWLAIADYYRQLEQLTGSPIVRLNRAVAWLKRVTSPRLSTCWTGSGEASPHSHRTPAVHAELLGRAGVSTEAAEAYDLAIVALC